MGMLPPRGMGALGLILLALSLAGTPAAALCPHDGDVNGDGRRTPADALLAFEHFLGRRELEACQQERADVPPSDGRITPADALCIFQAFLGLPTSCLHGVTFPFVLDVSRLDHPLYRLE